ncbi:MAG: class I SAM-dependent DNA methyltransferase, partial [Ardenticatenaceae bacterium]|nr:class I SAM-dependent DNA methyltransferase [Ardenticatenaceae bacterium]
MGETAANLIQTFINRWQNSGAAERANYQLFLTELADIIGVEHPRPKTPYEHENSYVFEKAVPSTHGTTNFIDLYKRGCFVLEAKQGSDQAEEKLDFSEKSSFYRKQRKRGTAVRGTAGWDTAMEKARNQGQSYIRSLPPAEIKDGRPPFLITVDVGATIALYSEFTRSGGNYVPFPDPNSYRLTLDDLHDAAVRDLLRTIWTNPMALDPAQRSARVTREIAGRLATLARSLEGEHEPDVVAQFLMRCLFTMFAEDVALLPDRSFTRLLADIRRDPASFKPMLEHLWATMNSGGFSVILRQELPQFNGGLFADQTALPLNEDQIQLLVEAARADWRDVEPAIFGTLLERALDPVERHKLGAHYTPRAYVERLVQPTVIEPLRQEWESVQAAALLHAETGETDKAIAEVEAFHRKLTSLKILDSACGSGNFLYVTLELMKRLEGEVLNTLRELGQGQMRLEIESVMITPQQFLGIEVNPRAAAIAELVLWIGFLQWHLRTRGETRPPEPIIKNFHNIECRDAVLEWDAIEPLLDEEGRPVTRWDGRTTKPHPVTGEEVPDETARVPVYRYINPHPAAWPQADIVVGNPPFIGGKYMRELLGDGYSESLRHVYSGIPKAADFVMFWWNKAANLLQNNELVRFGFITTNSLRQTFNRRVIDERMSSDKPLAIVFAIPDHPWTDNVDGANVRISMTVAERGNSEGKLKTVVSEKFTAREEAELEFSTRIGNILSDLTIGANVAGVKALESNSDLSNRGVQIFGSGFIVTKAEAQSLGLGTVEGIEKHIRNYRNGRDITQTSRDVMVIDLFGLTENEVKRKFPDIYQHVLLKVKPEREQNRRKSRRENWWIFGEPNPKLRKMVAGLPRYIVTPATSKHRFFLFQDEEVLSDDALVNIALSDGYHLGVLSSKIHIAWALVTGAILGPTPRYINSRCFDTFPFPDASDAQKAHIRSLAEQLDTHRKRQQAQHPSLTLTDMYNVLEKIRALDVGAHPRGRPEEAGQAEAGRAQGHAPTLTAKERQIHEQGLISILKQLHDDLDAAVFDAYGWPPDLADEEILQRLV